MKKFVHQIKAGEGSIHCHILHHGTNHNLEHLGGGGLSMILDEAGQ